MEANPASTAIVLGRSSAFYARVLALLVLALITDSYDLQATSFAAPMLAKAWHVMPASFAPLFGAGLGGVFVGALALGWFGDKFGRKSAVILSCLLYGGFSLATTLAASETQLFWLRFLMGLGCGGAMPNVVALATELAPARRRGMLTSLTFIGMPVGGAIPGYVASQLSPHFGWQAIFFVGGLGPLLFAFLIWRALPESPAFLAARRAGAQEASAQGAAAGRPLLRLLSRGHLATTLLLWLMFASTLMTIYLLSSWLPTLLRGAGLTALETANVNLLYAIGGALAGLALSLVIDRVGLSSVLGFFVLAIASVLGVAFSKVSQGGLAATIFFCGFAVTGVQYALNVSAGLIYPSEMRSSGVGAALGVGRAGSIFGALAGGPIVSGALGTFIGLHFGGLANAATFSGTRLFLVPAPVLLLGTLATLALMRLKDIREPRAA